MACRKKREHYTFDSLTMKDLLYVQLRHRGITKNMAVLLSVQQMAKQLRLIEEGWQIVALKGDVVHTEAAMQLSVGPAPAVEAAAESRRAGENKRETSTSKRSNRRSA